MTLGAIPPLTEGRSALGQSGQALDVRGFALKGAVQVPGFFELVVYEPVQDRLYATGWPASNPTDTPVYEIDPHTGTVVRTLWVPVRPRDLALTNDGHYLYFSTFSVYGVDPTLRRLDLVTGQIDLTFSGVVQPAGSGWGVRDLAVIPGLPGSILSLESDQYGQAPRINIIDQAALRTHHPLSSGLSSIVAVLDDHSILGIGQDGLYRGEIRADGAYISDTVPLPAGFSEVRYERGRLLSSDGKTLDLDTLSTVQRYQLPAGSGAVMLDLTGLWTYFVTSARMDFFAWEGGPPLGTIGLPQGGGSIWSLSEAGPGRVAISSGADMGGGNQLRIYTFAPQTAAAFLPTVMQADMTRVRVDHPIVDRCASFAYPHTGDAQANIQLCVTNVQERLDDRMNFLTRWTVTFLSDALPYLVKWSDVGNPNMYVLDEYGNRYDHVGLIGAAAEAVYFTRSAPEATGGYTFPPRKPGATTFRFFDADQGAEIGNIQIVP